MIVKAKQSFAGAIAMAKGEVRSIESDEVLKDLIRAGYVEAVKDNTAKDVVKNENKRNNRRSNP